MPQDIRPSGYFPQGTFIIPATQVERQRKLAEQLRRGRTSGPVQHWTQGAARIANALGSVLQEDRANQMEQGRYKALQEALRGGATPMQLFGTGDEQLMEVGKFLADQQRQKFEDERLAATTAENTRRWEAENQYRAAENTRQEAEAARDAARPPPVTPYESQVQKQQAEADADAAARVRAAQAFKAKVGRVRQSFSKSKPVIDASGRPVGEEFESGDDSLFGIVQSDPRYRAAANFLGDVFETSEPKRSALDALYSDLELDVAQMKMAKQGPVTENERLIARKTLGGLSNPDARTAWDILRQQEREADAIIAGSSGISGGPRPEVTMTTPRGQPRQHPIQGAPPPQPNVRAGQVPAPPSGGSEFSFGNWEEIPEGRLVRDESDGKMYRKINGQMVPQ